MPTSTTSSPLSSSESYASGATRNRDGSFAIRRWMDDTEGDRVAGRHVVLSSTFNHSLTPSSSREQRSSMRKSSKNQSYCKKARELDLTEVGAWCHLDQLRMANDDPDRSKSYQVPEPELRGAVGELQCVCKRLQSIIESLDRTT